MVGLDAGTLVVIIIAIVMLVISGLFLLAGRIAVWLDPDDSITPTWQPDGYQVQYDHMVPVGIAWPSKPGNIHF